MFSEERKTMTPAQEKLLEFLSANKRIPTPDEAVEIYASTSLRTGVQCLVTSRGRLSRDIRYNELRERSISWLKTSLGSLIIKGNIGVFLP